jgi:DNA-binding NarL/FixJ family response regulator
MDIEMPKSDGIEGVGRIKSTFPDIKVIMQTVYENEEKIFACLQNGADGYIL